MDAPLCPLMTPPNSTDGEQEIEAKKSFALTGGVDNEK